MVVATGNLLDNGPSTVFSFFGLGVIILRHLPRMASGLLLKL